MQISDNGRPINGKATPQCSLAPVPSMAGARHTSGRILDRPSRVTNYGVIAIDAQLSRRRVTAGADFAPRLTAWFALPQLERPAPPMLTIDRARIKQNGFRQGSRDNNLYG